MSINRRPIYQYLASLVDTRRRCEENNNGNGFVQQHEESILTIVKNFLPSGSGIDSDSGVEIDLDASTGEKLVFHFSYHHMDEGGMYDGWTDHTLTVKPSMMFAIDIKISGQNRNQVKDYFYDTFRHALLADVWMDESRDWHCSLYERETIS
jgi:hypothetical protein